MNPDELTLACVTCGEPCSCEQCWLCKRLRKSASSSVKAEIKEAEEDAAQWADWCISMIPEEHRRK